MAKQYDFTKAWEYLDEIYSRPDFNPDAVKKEKQPKIPKGLPSNVNPEFAAKHPTFTKVAQTLSAPIRAVAELPWFQRAGQTGSEVMTLQDRQDKVSTGSKVGDIAADIIGALIGFGASGNVGSAGRTIFEAGANVAGRALPATTRPVLRTAAELGAGSAAYEGTAALANQRPMSPGEMGLAAGANALLGVATHGALRLPELTRAAQQVDQITKIRNLDLRNIRQLSSAPERLALPPGRTNLIPEWTTDTGAIRQRGFVGQRPALPMTEPEAAMRHQLEMPLLPGRVDIRPEPPAQRRLLPEPTEEAALRPYAEQMGYKWPLTTQQRAEVQLHKLLDDIAQPVRERGVVPYESKRSLINFVYEGLGGNISKSEVRRLSYEQLADMAEDIVRENPPLMRIAEQEAAKRGVDLQDLFKTSGDPEYARWKEVVGLSEPPPQPLTPREPTKPTAELESARSILRRITDVDRAAKILDTYPELKPEFKGLVSRIELAQKRRAMAPPTPQQPAFEIKPNQPELDAARGILKNIKNPDRIRKIFEVYPELRKEFPKLARVIEKKQAIPKAPKVKTESKAKTQPPEKPPTPPDEPSKSGGDERIFTGDPTKLKDLSGFRLNFTDVYRNFEDVFGKQYGEIKKKLLDPFDAAKKTNVEFQEKLLTELKKKIVDELGIKKGSKESALVQMYGEKRISLDELKRRAPGKWKNIVEADKWFREKYDQLLDQVNAVRAQIYPNNPEKLIPRRKDYYRHFREIAQGVLGLKNIFDTPSNIDPRLEAISEFTLPKSKWLSFAQKRLGGRFENDAVGGFLNYVPAASYAIHIDPHIGRFERLADELAEATAESRNINNFINWLRRFAQDLAGKTNPMDRWIQDNVPGGRKTFQALNWLNDRIKANVVLGNASSALAQTANIPVGIAATKQYAAIGAGKTLKSIFTPNKDIAKSGFIKERYGSYGSKLYRQFDTSLLSKPFNFAVWMLESADKIGTHFIWNSAYAKALAEGVKNPVKYADDLTRRLVAGRGIGEVPLNQKARMFQLIAPFQVEVANLWAVQRDFVKARDFGALLLLYLGSAMFNKVMEQAKGQGVLFDPIQAMMDAITEEDLTPLERGGRVAGEVISNMPLGQTIAGLYPEYGFNFYGKEMPTRKELFGRNDPTRYGSGILIMKGIQDPIYKAMFPFAGTQVKKTIGATGALGDEGVYTSDKTKLKYPVSPTAANQLRGLLFGTSAFPETREYYEKNRRPLSEKQTEGFKQAVNMGISPKKAYDKVMREREIKKIEEQIKEIHKDKTIPIREKQRKIKELREKAIQINMGR